MKFSLLDMVVVVAYLLGIGTLGIWQVRKVKSSGDYYAGGRKYNKFMMIMHQLGSGTNLNDPVSVVGASFQRGLSGIWYTYVFLFITPFYWLIAPYFRRSRFLTTSDFFESRYSSRLSLLYTIWGVMIFTINIGTMLKGIGTIVDTLSGGKVPEWAAIGAMTAVFLAYGTMGGLVSTIVTETVQGLLIVVMSLLLIPFGLNVVGGFAGLHQTLSPAMFNLAANEEITIGWILGMSIANLIGIVAQPHMMEVCAAGKTEWEGRMGFTYGSMFKRFCALGWALTGVIMAAMVIKNPALGAAKREMAFGIAIRELVPAGLMGLMLAAILAAQMAALSAFMVGGSALLSRNIYLRHLKPHAADRDVMRVGRIAGIGIVFLGMAFAYLVPGVADALTIFWSLTTITGVMMWAGVLWRRANPAGCWAAFAVMTPIWFILGPPGLLLHKALPAADWLGKYADKSQAHMLLLCYLPAGILAMVLGSILGARNDEKKVDDFNALMSTPVGREHELEARGIKMVYKGRSEGHPWELNHPRLVNALGFVAALGFVSIFFAVLYMLGRLGA